MPVKAGLLGYVVHSFVISITGTEDYQLSKKATKRSIDDNLRQLVLIRQGRVLVN